MTTGQIVGSVDALRRVIAGRETGLVPTMGALHEGHVSLIRRAAADNDIAVVSIFVNPTQFTDPTDLARYPRDLATDAEAAIGAGAAIIYAPAAETVYPSGFSTSVEVSGLDTVYEGASRPGHFRGVATVVSILLNSVRPSRTYFGEKDYQQLAIVRRMHRDLVLPGAIVGCPTVRDSDGLALSSRNRRLSANGRRAAKTIPTAQGAIQQAYEAGERSSMTLLDAGRGVLDAEPAVRVDYLDIVAGETLVSADTASDASRILIAVEIDGIRLIDNVAMGDPVLRSISIAP